MLLNLNKNNITLIGVGILIVLLLLYDEGYLSKSNYLQCQKNNSSKPFFLKIKKKRSWAYEYLDNKFKKDQWIAKYTVSTKENYIVLDQIDSVYSLEDNKSLSQLTAVNFLNRNTLKFYNPLKKKILAVCVDIKAKKKI